MEERVPDLRETIRALWRRKVVIAFTMAAVTAAAVFTSASRPKEYTSTAQMVIHPLFTGSALSSSSAKDGGPLGVDVSPETQIQVLKSPVVAKRVATRLAGNAAALRGSVDAQLVTEELLAIVASAPSPNAAADLANAYVEEFLGYRRAVADDAVSSLAKDLSRRLDGVQKRISSLDAQIIKLSAEAAAIAPGSANPTPGQAAAKAQRVAAIAQLTGERDALISQAAPIRARLDDARSTNTSGSGGEIIASAVAPAAPSAPRPIRDGAIGLLIGLVIGAGIALVLHYLDDRIRSSGDVLRAGGARLVGVVPRARRWHRRAEPYLATVAEPQSSAAESYRGLREALVPAGLGSKLRTILVTSGGSQSGKTATAANFAVACGQAGMRVVIVCADMRKPRVHAFFGLPNDRGFGDALREGRSVRPFVQPTSIPNVYVLPAGAPPQNPAELLDRKDLNAVLSDLLEVADLVIVDAPAMSSGADAVVLARSCDFTMVVARYMSATTEGVASAVSNLRQAGAKDVAVVLNAAEGHSTVAAMSYAPPVAPPTNGHSNGDAAERVAHAVPARVEVAVASPRPAAAPRPRAPRRRTTDDSATTGE